MLPNDWVGQKAFVRTNYCPSLSISYDFLLRNAILVVPTILFFHIKLLQSVLPRRDIKNSLEILVVCVFVQYSSIYRSDSEALRKTMLPL